VKVGVGGALSSGLGEQRGVKCVTKGVREEEAEKAEILTLSNKRKKRKISAGGRLFWKYAKWGKGRKKGDGLRTGKKRKS